jgi:hypothetical protein
VLADAIIVGLKAEKMDDRSRMMEVFEYDKAVRPAQWEEATRDALKTAWKTFWDVTQFSLDVAGFLPYVGEVFDGLNGCIHLARGNMLDAGISFVAMAPLAGDVVKLNRLGKAASLGKRLFKFVKVGDNFAGAAKWMRGASKVDKLHGFSKICKMDIPVCFVGDTEVVVGYAGLDGALIHADAAWTTPPDPKQPAVLGVVCLLAAAGVVLDDRRRRKQQQREAAEIHQRALDALFHADDLLDELNHEPEPLSAISAEAPRPVLDRIFSETDGDLATAARLAVLDRPVAGRKMEGRRRVLKPLSEPKPEMKSTVLDKPKKTSFGRLLIAAVLGIFGLAMLWQGLAPSVASHRTSASIAATQQAGPKYETKKFKDIRKGDMVLARDEYGNEIGLRRVVELYRSTSDHLRILEFESDGGTLQKLETTDEHPFWDEKKATHVAAKDLCVGDQVVGPNGEPSRLVSTRHEPHPEGIEVFNFQVEGAHTYYVKSHGINAPPVLVHNACGPKLNIPKPKIKGTQFAKTGLPTQVHHFATNKGKWGEKFKHLFDKVGVSLDDVVNKMDLPGHAGRHTNAYHELVYKRLKEAVAGKSGKAARDALTRTLKRLRKELKANPRLPYTDGGL